MRNLKKTNPVLIFAVILCLSYSVFQAGKFIASHIPPYKEGQCLQPKKEGLEGALAKIEKNHLLNAVSDVGLFYFGYKLSELSVTFQDLRDVEEKFTKVNCF